MTDASRSLSLVLTLAHVLCLSAARAQTPAASPTVETVPVPSSGDAADDAAIWVHPTDPALSLVIGTDKDSGLVVHDLGGNRLQHVAHGPFNNVDIRAGFPLAGGEATLVTTGERDLDRLAIYALDPLAASLVPVAAREIALGIEVYGSCMYQSPWTGDTYFFCTSEDGLLQQWRLFAAGGNATVDAELLRSLDVGSVSEGCVADDENSYLFVGEEGQGIWRYGAEPGAGDARVLVDTTSAGGHLAADVEGLALYLAPGGAGYLLASSQGDDTFAVYERRPPHEHRLSFQLAANAGLGIDAVSGTDGIDVTSLGLGSAFPSGLFVAQDGSNPGANQNFKLVPWQDIAALADPPLLVAYHALSAAFTASAPGPDPLQIAFTDRSTGNVTSWSWDFGDGASSSEEHPVHVYAAAGSFVVGLSVSGPDGSASTQDVVMVGASGGGEGSGGTGGSGGGGCFTVHGQDGRPRGDASLALALAAVLIVLVLRRSHAQRAGDREGVLAGRR